MLIYYDTKESAAVANISPKVLLKASQTLPDSMRMKFFLLSEDIEGVNHPQRSICLRRVILYDLQTHPHNSVCNHTNIPTSHFEHHINDLCRNRFLSKGVRSTFRSSTSLLPD